MKFFRSEYVRPEPKIIYPEWTPEADKRVLHIEGLQPVPWEYFGAMAKRKGGMEFCALKQRRFEDCSVTPGPDNE
jgi:hypothetical protein